jgi:SAM-dependent methyltransferase
VVNVNYHDVLAQLGVGSAHPGGFAATVALVSKIPLKSGMKVLEVGCGSGRTACYLARERLCEVTGIDIRPLMIEKAERRAIKEGLRVKFICADVCQLPFPDNTFDVVFVESVTVFLPLRKALSEYFRVLVPGGVLYDREMVELKPHPQELRKKIARLYEAKQVPSFDGWIRELQQAGFKDCSVIDPCTVASSYSSMDDRNFPDSHQEISLEAFTSGEIQKIAQENTELMIEYADYLGYGVFHGTKK